MKNLKMLLQYKILSLLHMNFVRYKGFVLPPRYLRHCAEFQDDETFFHFAKLDVDRLIKNCHLDTEKCILDVGSGTGRLAFGILNQLGEIKSYQGIDVLPLQVDWCQRHITPFHPMFQFKRLDLKNSRYNPNGEVLDSNFKFPFGGDDFNIIYLYSVFSHMEEKDMCVYLHDFRRVIKKDGFLFFTTFVERNVPDFTINPDNYRLNWGNGPLHCVRYDFDYLTKLLERYGFEISTFLYESDTNGQSAIIANVI
jgi:SAM-dependent methyltransferase